MLATGSRSWSRADRGRGRILDSKTASDESAVPVRPRYILFLFACMTALNVMDRQLLSVLIDPIKTEFGVSDRAMGLLTGTAFAVLHGTAGIPIGLAADRGVRRTIVSTGLAIWSLLTLLTGFARSYAEIFAIRVGVGIGEAAGGAPSQSLLADVFPPERRATALSILAIGGPLGSVLVFALGGWLADAYGWRVAFMVFGAPGLLLAALIRFSVPEPARGLHDTHTIPFLVGLRFVFTVSSIRSVLFASGLHATAVYAVLGWSVPYLTRVHGISTTEAGARLAVASGLLSALGTLVGGALADRLGQRDRRWLVWQPAIALLLAFPFAVGFLFAHSASAAMWLLAPVSVLTGSCLGPFYSVVQTVVPARMRALSAALVITSNTILGLGIGPPLVGWLNDVGAARFGAESIRYSLLAAMSMVLVSAGFLGWAGRSLEADLAAPRLDARGATGG